jgi:RNA polymerase sigma-70 factor (ECF subfamily)
MAKQFAGNEERLLKQARAGNSEAFSKLVQTHWSRVYGISLRILKNREDAEDNLQNVLCKAYRNIRQFHGNAKISTWLFRIAVNEAFMKLRKRQSVREISYADVCGYDEDDEKGIFAVEDHHADPERRCIASDLTTKAFQAVDSSMSDVFVLNKTEGWTNRELAKAFGTTVETVKSRIFRTRVRLREQLAAISSETPAIAGQA